MKSKYHIHLELCSIKIQRKMIWLVKKFHEARFIILGEQILLIWVSLVLNVLVFGYFHQMMFSMF